MDRPSGVFQHRRCLGAKTRGGIGNGRRPGRIFPAGILGPPRGRHRGSFLCRVSPGEVRNRYLAFANGVLVGRHPMAPRISPKKSWEGFAGSVVASDAFFPFRDGLDVVVDAGAIAVIQPGGSVRDDEVIAAADERGVAMVFTGVRHFRH